MFQKKEKAVTALPPVFNQDTLEKTFTNEFMIGRITISTCDYLNRFIDKLDAFKLVDNLNEDSVVLSTEQQMLADELDQHIEKLDEEEHTIECLQKALNDVPFSDRSARVEIYEELTAFRKVIYDNIKKMGPKKNRIHQLAVIRRNSRKIKVHDFVLRLVELLHDPATGVSDFENGPYSSDTPQDVMHRGVQKEYSKRKLKDKTYRLNKDTLRVIKYSDLIKSCVSFPMFRQADLEYAESVDIVCAFLYVVDGIMFNAFPTDYVKVYPDGSTRASSITYVVFDFLEDAQEAGAYNLDSKSFPLVEQPVDWDKDTIGGYIYTDKNKCTKKRGASQQPETVFSGLNSLQHNKFKLADHVNVGDYRKFLYDKFCKKYAGTDVPDNHLHDRMTRMVSNITPSFEYVTNVYKDGRPFYFEFMYDFRGRAYSTGYDINLQADKYKKAMIIPHADNFQADCYFADTKQIETLKGLLDD